jgi:large-conductance mechanosensitive channel
MVFDKINLGLKGFQTFIGTQELVIIASAVVVGLATKEFLGKLFPSIVDPLLVLAAKTSLLSRLTVYGASKIPKRYLFAHTFFGIIRMVTWNFLQWLAVLLLTFVLFEKVLTRGISTSERLRVPLKDQDIIGFVEKVRALNFEPAVEVASPRTVGKNHLSTGPLRSNLI